MSKEKDLERAQKYVNNLHDYYVSHGYKWLDLEAAIIYRDKASSISTENDVGQRRQLRQKLQEEYGLLEIEAINVLNGHHINEYVNKYYRIKHRIPTEVIRTKDFDDEEGDDWY